jgi:hypothetical protein
MKLGVHPGPRDAHPDHWRGGAYDTLIITDANESMRVHDGMAVILVTDAARRWMEPEPLPGVLPMPFPAREVLAWWVGDYAKISRIEPHEGMAEPVVERLLQPKHTEGNSR